MTTALCLTRGATELGAFTPRADGQAGSTGDQALEIAFSDPCVSGAAALRLMR